MCNLFQLCDFHVHTYLSPCAVSEMRPAAIVEACESRGIRSLGITDHVAVSTDVGILSQVRRELASLKTAVKVFVGCEADLLGENRHTVTDQMISELDYVCVSANHFHLSSVSQPEDESPKAVGRHFVRMLGYACSLGFVDFVAHPLYVFPGTFDPTFLESIEDDDLVNVLRLAKINDIAMEISPRSLDREQLFFRMRFLFLCREVGLKFSFGSDAHRLSNVGSTHLLAPIVRELRLTDEDIWLPRGAE